MLVVLTNLLFAWLAVSEPSLVWLAMVVSADNLSGGLAVSAFIAYLSSLTNTAYTAHPVCAVQLADDLPREVPRRVLGGHGGRLRLRAVFCLRLGTGHPGGPAGGVSRLPGTGAALTLAQGFLIIGGAGCAPAVPGCAFCSITGIVTAATLPETVGSLTPQGVRDSALEAVIQCFW